MKLTDKICKNQKPTDKPVKMADGGGLFLLTQPNGKKYWRMKYRYIGKEKLLSFGEYPLVSLANTREKRDETKKLLLRKIDPSEQKKQERRKQEIEFENSFKAIALEWHKNQSELWSDSHAKYTLRRLELNIFPAFGKKPISLIEAPEILDALRKVQERGANEMATRLHSICSQVFRYGIVTWRAKRNPAQDIQGL